MAAPSDPIITIQACKHCGTGAPVDAHFCPQCDKILTLARHGDYFSFLGMPRKLRLDLRELDERLRALSRQFHPDYFYNSTPAERLASLERSSYLNDAYRALRQRPSRVEYLLKVEGLPLKGAAGAGSNARTEVPASLLEEVFAFNEQLDEIREAREAGESAEALRPRIEVARRPIEQKRAEQDARFDALADSWDASIDAGASADERRPILEQLREWLLEQAYIDNLLATVRREMGL